MANLKYPSTELNTEIIQTVSPDKRLILLKQGDDGNKLSLVDRPIFTEIRIYLDMSDPDIVHLTLINKDMVYFSPPHARKLKSMIEVRVSYRQTGDESGEVNPVQAVIRKDSILELVTRLSTVGSKDPLCTAFNKTSDEAYDHRVFISRKMADKIVSAVAVLTSNFDANPPRIAHSGLNI